MTLFFVCNVQTKLRKKIIVSFDFMIYNKSVIKTLLLNRNSYGFATLKICY